MLLHGERKGGGKPCEGILGHPLNLGKHKYIIDIRTQSQTHTQESILSFCLPGEVKVCE